MYQRPPSLSQDEVVGKEALAQWGSGSGPGVKVLLCVGRNIDEGGVALLTDEEGDSFNGDSPVGQGGQ